MTQNDVLKMGLNSYLQALEHAKDLFITTIDAQIAIFKERVKELEENAVTL